MQFNCRYNKAIASPQISQTLGCVIILRSYRTILHSLHFKTAYPASCWELHNSNPSNNSDITVELSQNLAKFIKSLAFLPIQKA
ncbi:hypothetical protein FDUTEX481_04415 [Tolypothrix sp. PCC 7601]|nr:hypothetical protein FDUTEX481_04415 [Tolypothrix sp. PCC 7601]